MADEQDPNTVMVLPDYGELFVSAELSAEGQIPVIVEYRVDQERGIVLRDGRTLSEAFPDLRFGLPSINTLYTKFHSVVLGAAQAKLAESQARVDGLEGKLRETVPLLEELRDLRGKYSGIEAQLQQVQADLQVPVVESAALDLKTGALNYKIAGIGYRVFWNQEKGVFLDAAGKPVDQNLVPQLVIHQVYNARINALAEDLAKYQALGAPEELKGRLDAAQSIVTPVGASAQAELTDKFLELAETFSAQGRHGSAVAVYNCLATQNPIDVRPVAALIALHKEIGDSATVARLKAYAAERGLKLE